MIVHPILGHGVRHELHTRPVLVSTAADVTHSELQWPVKHFVDCAERGLLPGFKVREVACSGVCACSN